VGRRNRRHCRDWGGLKGSAFSRPPTIEPRRCRRFFADGQTTSVGRRSSSRQRAIRIKQSGRGTGTEGREGKSWPMIDRCRICIAVQRRCTACCRRTSPLFCEEIGASECFFVFIVLHFPFFFVRKNHHSITEIRASFHAFFSFFLDLPLSDHGKKTDTRHWKRVWSGRGKKNITEVLHWVGASCFFFSLIFSCLRALLTCTRETQRVEMIGSWSCLFGFVRLSKPTLFCNSEIGWRSR
jgi:hypothetical protein